MKKKTLNVNMNEKSSMSQNKMIMRDLKKGKKITPLYALKAYGCFRLGARIWELKQPPFSLNIKKDIVIYNGKKFAQYSIVKP